MDKILKRILSTIENAGFEAFLVGGFVRDYLLGIKTFDVDICTNALPKDLHELFPNNNNSNNYGGFNLQIKGYNIDITTYRKELKYNLRRPTEIMYINDLNIDVLRRDFTINAVCMDKNEKIIDLVNGIDDINNHLIRMVDSKNIKNRLEEDPLRILRAIRFASVLNFDIEENLYKEIKENYQLVKTLSNTRIKSELTKILLNKNYQKGLKLLKNLKILDLLNISYDDVVYVNDICGMWAQLNTPQSYTFTKQENRNIISIRQIINKGIIDNKVLYKHGLYNSLVASDILNINKKDINVMYEKLPIKSANDLAITNEEIIHLLDILPSKKISDIKNEMINLILEEKLKNDNKILREYVIKRKEC